MIKSDLLQLFERDLHKLREEIGLYATETAIWETRPGITNSAGNLCLHLVGNLQHFIGAVLGNTDYIRHRDSEFSLKNIPRSELFSSIDQTMAVVKNTLENLSEMDFTKTYPYERDGRAVSTGYTLIHLFAHLNYHLGQINYHRRMIS